MKPIYKSALTLGLISLLAMACENPIRMETIVHEDGSLEKTIEFQKADSSLLKKNVFNINESKGWKATVSKSTYDSASEKNKDNLNVKFEKNFKSVDEANQELNTETDSLFHVESKFQKSFRWFYTYIRYSETFKPIDRLKKINSTEYFNQEDLSFINRLPGEGKIISKADSFFLGNLNRKIFEEYARIGMFYEQYDILKEVISHNLDDKKWLDTLTKNQDFIYEKLEDMEGDPFFAAKIADSLRIPLPKEAAKDFNELSKDLNSRISFMGYARDGKYINIIEMPWTIVESNADSISGNQLFWRPLTTKFAVTEYEMYVEARKLNWWAVIVSSVILFASIFAFRKKDP